MNTNNLPTALRFDLSGCYRDSLGNLWDVVDEKYAGQPKSRDVECTRQMDGYVYRETRATFALWTWKKVKDDEQSEGPAE